MDILRPHRKNEIKNWKELKMPEIGTRENIIPDELNNLIKNNFSNPIAVLERLYCKVNEDPDFFNYLSIPHGKESDWDKGRVFDDISEIRWERKNDVFHLVWIKDQGSIPAKWSPEQIKLVTPDRKILLWGKKIEGKNKWYEKQIPRIFEYPAKVSATYVFAVINVYCIENKYCVGDENCIVDESKIYRFKDVISE